MISEQDYAALLERVDRLEQAQADQLVPGVFSLNAAGEVGAELSGKLKASGITFNLGTLKNATSGKPAERVTSEILWTLSSTGATGAAIAAYKYSAKPPALPKGIILSLAAVDQNTAAEAQLQVIAEEGPASVQRVTAIAGAQVVKLLDSTGASDFLQLTSGGGSRRRIQLTTGTLEWAGVSQFSQGLEINLGAEPITGGLSLTPIHGPIAFFVMLNSIAGNVLTLQALCPTGVPAGGTKSEVWILAITA